MFTSPRAALKQLAVAYLLVCVFMFSIQKSLTYHAITGVKPPADYHLEGFNDIKLVTKDGIALSLWYKPAREGRKTIIFFHGNAGNLGYGSRYLKILSRDGLGILALDYRGFGNSEGSPSEAGLYEDAETTYNYATNTLHLAESQLVIYGESLGTGVALEVASHTHPAGVVLQSPYTSVEEVGAKRYFWLPVHFMIRDHYDSMEKIGKVTAPLLFIHGDQDTIVPFEQGKRLFEAANEPKTFITLPGKGHNDMDREQLAQETFKFIETCCAK